MAGYFYVSTTLFVKYDFLWLSQFYRVKYCWCLTQFTPSFDILRWSVKKHGVNWSICHSGEAQFHVRMFWAQSLEYINILISMNKTMPLTLNYQLNVKSWHRELHFRVWIRRAQRWLRAAPLDGSHSRSVKGINGVDICVIHVRVLRPNTRHTLFFNSAARRRMTGKAEESIDSHEWERENG